MNREYKYKNKTLPGLSASSAVRDCHVYLWCRFSILYRLVPCINGTVQSACRYLRTGRYKNRRMATLCTFDNYYCPCFVYFCHRHDFHSKYNILSTINKYKHTPFCENTLPSIHPLAVLRNIDYFIYYIFIPFLQRGARINFTSRW